MLIGLNDYIHYDFLSKFDNMQGTLYSIDTNIIELCIVNARDHAIHCILSIIGEKIPYLTDETLN